MWNAVLSARTAGHAPRLLDQHLQRRDVKIDAGPNQQAESPSLISENMEDGRLAASPPQRSWAEVEKKMIIEALIKTGGRKNRAAQSLGWSRCTLWRKMKQYDIR